jgi:hypothetical protein
VDKNHHDPDLEIIRETPIPCGTLLHPPVFIEPVYICGVFSGSASIIDQDL